MSKRTDSNGYTMIFAVIMVFVVGSLLAFLASSLKPAIKENERIEKQQNILYAMGVNENDASSANFVSTTVAGAEYFVDKSFELLGNLDTLVNNAGTFLDQDFENISEENFDKTINLNVRGYMFASKAFAKKFYPDKVYKKWKLIL